MYKANQRHLQPLLISHVNELPEQKRKRLKESWADVFYREFFSRIQEAAFAVLYVEHPSRPNVPINWLVGLETLKAGFGWSDEELYDHFCFDLQVRYALGIHDLNESDFDLRSLYYFRQRLSRYNLEQGVNLLTKAFEQITDQQLTTLKVKTGKQRMDSTEVASNILDMSRLQLLVEAVQRLARMLSEADQARYATVLAPYLQGHSGQYVYRIKGQDATDTHLQQIGELIYRLLSELREGYAAEPVYQVLQRFFEENFRRVGQGVHAKTNPELAAGCLQSVDDLEATYRKKGTRAYKGYVANVAETCDPDNALQLITQVQVAPNNVEDADLLSQALPGLQARTGVKTLYTDGAFASPRVDAVLQAQQVEQIQTGIRGRKLHPGQLNLSDFDIQLDGSGHPLQVTCPQGQTVPACLSSHQRGYRADFDPQVCQTCPFQFAGRCPAHPGKKRPTYRLPFLPEQAVVAGRRRELRLHQQSGHNYRAAIEGTIRELKHPFPASKLPVRGLFRMTCMLVASATMTNVRRIQHYFERKCLEQRRIDASERSQSVTLGQPGISFSLFLKALASGVRPTVMLFKPCLSY